MSVVWSDFQDQLFQEKLCPIGISLLYLSVSLLLS